MIRKKTCRLVLAAFLLVSVSACATFRGPPPLEMNVTSDNFSGSKPVSDPSADIAGPARAPTGQPSLSLNGARGDTHPADDVAFDWPVDEARMTRGFLSAPAKRKRPHWGVDLANKRDTPIMAAEEGEIIYTGHAFRGYGKLIVIEHGPDWATLYSHLDRILVKEGQHIKRGEKIALMGRTGRATGVHLHFEIRHFRQPVNPLAFLPEVGEEPRYAGRSHAGTSNIRISQHGGQDDAAAEE